MFCVLRVSGVNFLPFDFRPFSIGRAFIFGKSYRTVTAICGVHHMQFSQDLRHLDDEICAKYVRRGHVGLLIAALSGVLLVIVLFMNFARTYGGA